MPNHQDLANLIWQIADLLRGPYRPPQYERVMLPMTVLRRFDCVLASTKSKVLAEYARRKGGKFNDEALDRLLNRTADQRFHNHSPLDFEKLKGDPDNIEKHLVSYIKGFSVNVRTIFDFFEFENEIEKMREANVLYLVVSKFCDVDLHPKVVPNEQMGLIFENLIRRFNELANETAGDHFTPREVIRLMVSILFIHDDRLLATPGTVRELLDPACGTGGMLAEAQNYLREHNSEAKLYVYGQDYNKRAFATAASDMLIKQVDHNGTGDSVRFGDSFTDDQFAGEKFDYLLANPPFGVDWKRQQREIEHEHDKLGFAGRFGAGLPRVNDGSLLFLQHMISKFEPVMPDQHKHGSRLAIVFSGSPLFSGGAGSGESDIRKWIIENDWLEGIVALPEQMFYNTGIGTFVWIVTNRKERRRKGKIQILDAREFYVPMRRSLGNKRRKIGEKEDGSDQIAEIVQLYGRFADGDASKIFDNADFGYLRLTVERPLRLRYQMTVQDKARFLDACPHLLDDLQAIDDALGREPHGDWNAIWARIEELLRKRKSRWKVTEQKLFRAVFTQKDPDAKLVLKGSHEEAYEPDPDLRDFENVPLREDVDTYFVREVAPHVPDAWMDRSKDRVGYEINFNRHFYRHMPPRSLEEIDADLKNAEEEIIRLLKEAEKRDTLFTRAITHGIDAIGPFRKTGLAWPSTVRRGWEVLRLKWLVASVESGVSVNATDQPAAAGEPGVLKTSAVSGGRFLPAENKAVWASEIDRLACSVRRDTIIMSRMNTPSLVAESGYVYENYPDLFLPDRLWQIAFDSQLVFTPFMAKVLACAEARSALSEMATGTSGSMKNLAQEDMLSLRVPLPPIAEQRAISVYIEAETAKLDALRMATERTLNLLRERRAAIVAFAVDGQLHVPDSA